jgi:hypothetical protein
MNISDRLPAAGLSIRGSFRLFQPGRLRAGTVRRSGIARPREATESSETVEKVIEIGEFAWNGFGGVFLGCAVVGLSPHDFAASADFFMRHGIACLHCQGRMSFSNARCT